MAESLLQRMFPHALYVKSAGVKKGELDPFAVAVMAELGQDISGHKPTTFEELDDWEGLNFDLIITLSPEAHHRALELTRTLAAEVEYWPTHDPTGTEGNREQKLEAYREVCDGLLMRIRKRFAKGGRGERVTERRRPSLSRLRGRVPSKARRVGALSANPVAERAPTPTLPRKRERGEQRRPTVVVSTNPFR